MFKKIMTVVIDLGGRYFRLRRLFWDADDWVENCLITCYFYREFGSTLALRKRKIKKKRVGYPTFYYVCMNNM